MTLYRYLVLAVVCGGCLLLVACSGISYLGQATAGQLSIWWRQQPIESLLEDPQTDPELARRLRLVLDIRRFASEELALPDNDSYRSFVELAQPYVVWNVFAAEEFSVEPETWCFPIAGCVSYRGYFSREDASDFQRQLVSEGYDTYLAGVPAYSTLGWFDDPLLSSVLHYDDAQLTGLIFHELAHQQLYLAGDTTFNESFATALEIEGVRRWFEARGNPRALDRYLEALSQRRDLVATLLVLREQLAALYRQDMDTARKRHEKQALLEQFVQHDLPQFRRRWPQQGQPDSQYDNGAEWLARDLNNARLVTISSYYQWLDAFRQLMQDAGGDIEAFYRGAEALSLLEEPERQRQLQQLTAKFEKWQGSDSL